MSSYVFDGADWICLPCGVKGTIKKNIGSVSGIGKPMLTDIDMPSPNGAVCPSNQGAPCVPTILLGWVNCSKTVKCNGHYALLSSSTASCARGGEIHIIGGLPSIAEGAKFSGVIGAESHSQSYEQPKASETANAQASVPPTDDDTDNDTTISEEKTSDESETNSTEKTFLSPDEYRKRRWCSGRCPAEYSQNCLFRKAAADGLKLTNSSQKLKGNLISDVRAIYERYDNSISEISYTPECGDPVNSALAHHHLIPGNECFEKKKFDGTCKYELLIKLANLFDYDVNNTLNGILLPTYSNKTLSGISGKEKPKMFYNAMTKASEICGQLENKENEKYIGAQLHVGQHVYEARMGLLKIEHPEAIRCRSYESIVLIDYLEMMQDFYLNRYETTCFMKDFDSEKKDFHKRINYISSELRKKVNAFPRDGTRLSWLDKRVYVSFPAMLYDLGISVDEYIEKYSG